MLNRKLGQSLHVILEETLLDTGAQLEHLHENP